jgi:RNA polymerase sigma factor (sigma-70 family)
VEREWVSGLRSGDAAAFDAVYAHYHRRIYDFLHRLSGRRDLAEDLFQETFMRLARNATSLREDTDLGGWLFTVARNAYRSHRRWLLVDLGRTRGFEVEAAAGPEQLPEQIIDSRRRLAALERALAQLPINEREVLLLVAVEGMEQEQAAQVLGIGYDALRKRLSRARALLQEKIGEPRKETA